MYKFAALAVISELFASEGLHTAYKLNTLCLSLIIPHNFDLFDKTFSPLYNIQNPVRRTT